jgi:hypothetical protein
VKAVQDVNGIAERRYVDDPERTGGIADADFPHARPDRVHGPPVVRIAATLQLVDLVPGLTPRHGRECAQIIKGAAPEHDGLEIGHRRRAIQDFV